MGTVFEAVDEAGAGVAVKTLSAHLGDDSGLRARFAAEIEALKALRHPGIVQLLAFGEEEGRPFFAMELVRGRSLEEILRSGRRFDWRETATIAADVTRALKSAHDRGIVHRDLKPANLLFPDEPGPETRVKLADFGIARLFGETGQTQAGTVVGTAEYMAPEQAAGAAVDARVDLYALGLVMFAMLTGRPPFRGGDVTEVLRRQRKEQPPRVSAIVPGVPEAVDDLVARLLAKDPADRPPNALAVGRSLAALDQADATARILDKIPGRAALLARLTEIEQSASGVVSQIRQSEGDRWFYLKRDPNDSQFRLVWRQGLAGPEHVIYDPQEPTKLSGKPHGIMDYAPAPAGRKAAPPAAPAPTPPAQ